MDENAGGAAQLPTSCARAPNEAALGRATWSLGVVRAGRDRGLLVCDHRRMTSEVDPAAQALVILASFENRYAAEHFLASLGRDFRKQARKGRLSAFVVSGNKDGSLKLTQSRVLTTAGLTSALIRVSASMMVGLIGMFSMLKGANVERHALGERAAHVGLDEHKAHPILAQAGPNAAITMVCCDDPEMGQTVASHASDRAIASWDGSRSEFLADLDPGSTHDWVRTALGEPSRAKG